MRKKRKSNPAGRVLEVKVWDLPIRLFHWLLVGLVLSSFVTGNLGGNAMRYHMLSGYTILALLLFRIFWGLAGSRTARFSSFLATPAVAWRYAGQLLMKQYPRHLGHNPLGGWSIVAMLLTLMLQAVTGLFADDGILTQGPLSLWVSRDTSHLLTTIHLFNKNLIVALVALHVLAVVFYLAVKGDNLIMPMITGVKQWRGQPDQAVDIAPTWLAVIAMALSALAVYLLVH